MIGSSLCHLGRLAEATGTLQQVQISKLKEQTLDLWGQGLVQEHWWPQANEVYYEIHRRRPRDPVVLQQLAVLQFQVGEVNSALQLSEELVNFTQHAAAAYCIQGTVHEALAHPSAAAECFAKSLDLVGAGQSLPVPPAQVLEKLIVNLKALGDYEEAQRRLEQIVAANPSAQLLSELAEVLLAKGDPKSARNQWVTALRIQKLYPDAIIGMGRLALVESQPMEAIGWFKLAKDQGVSTSALEYMLSTAYRRVGRNDLAEQHRLEHHRLMELGQRFERDQLTVAANPGSPHALLLLARHALELGDWREAEGHLRELERLFPYDPAVQSLLAEVRAQSGAAPLIPKP